MSTWNGLEALLPVMLDTVLKSIVVLAGAGLVTAGMRSASAAKRHVVWTLAVVVVLAMPGMSAWLPAWRVLPDWAEPGQLLTADGAARGLGEADDNALIAFDAAAWLDPMHATDTEAVDAGDVGLLENDLM